MPRKATVNSFEERVSESFLEDVRNVAERIAAESGDPPGAGKVGDAEAVRLFGQADPLVADDPDYFKQALGQGLAEEVVGQLVIVKEVPELAEVYMQPAPDEETADLLVRLAEYPFRWGLVVDFSDDPDEQVARAKHLDRLWQKGREREPMPDAMGAPVAAPVQPAPVPAPMPPPAPPVVAPQYAPQGPAPIDPASMIGG